MILIGEMIMARRTLVALLLAGLMIGSNPAAAQVGPALPTWNWDNPTQDTTPWAPAALTVVEIVALGVAVDLFFGGRISGIVYRGAISLVSGVIGGGRAAVATVVAP